MISNNFRNVTTSSLTLILCFSTGQPFENTVSTLDILAVLLSDEKICYYVVYASYNSAMKQLCRRIDCPDPERELLVWRATCMGKMIMASDITHIRDETIK